LQTRTRSLTQRTQSLKSRTLNIANAELMAANSERTFSEEYDRLGAIDGLLNTPLYQEDSSALLPSARRFLNKALYNYSAIDMPKLQHVLDTESMTEDFSFSPDRRSIVAYDARNTYVFDVATGELIVRNLPSAVTQIGYRGTSGWVSVYTSQGAQYHYNILTDYSILGNVLTDSSVFSADGSRKLVWVSNNLSAALGKQSNRIMVYFSEESQAASTIPGDGNGFSRVTEGNDCIYSVSKTKLFVHDKNTKKERFRFNIDYSMGPSVVCRDSLYVLDNDADYIHIYNGENGEEYYINISGLSRYSVHYQHHTKI